MHRDAKVGTTLLATDLQRSVLNALFAARPHPLAYTPYGHRPAENGLLSLLGFNGERPDPLTGHYHLGNGYRQFNPVLMRFNSPDSWSPFGDGGLNAYVYCADDPVNQEDRDGHAPKWITNFFNIFRSKRPRTNFGAPSQSSPITRLPVSDLFKGERFSEVGINEGKLLLTQSSQTHLSNQVSFYENNISTYQTITTKNNTFLTHITSKLNIPTEHAEYIDILQSHLSQKNG
ncbi:RHS repeat-associated core domain-containing protein [Pseudomonas azerbaijanoccidentalis]